MREAEAVAFFVVPTPIGNLGDITERAVEVLRSVDRIAAEDTRRTKILLDHLGISTPLTSYHEHNEKSKAVELVAAVRDGISIALVSDAGMPCVSDPGYQILFELREAGIPYTVLPGPSSVITAVAASGFGGGGFYFGGFLPVKSGGRQTELQHAVERVVPSVFFESPHRIVKSIEDLAGIDPGRAVFIGRELTKRFEEYLHGSAREMAALLTARDAVKGEFVLVVSGASKREARKLTRARSVVE